VERIIRRDKFPAISPNLAVKQDVHDVLSKLEKVDVSHLSATATAAKQADAVKDVTPDR
jgi:hypothetical protein